MNNELFGNTEVANRGKKRHKGGKKKR